MTDLEYQAAMDTLAAAVRLMLTVDVDELRAVVAQSETLGPILEPTAYAHGGGRRLAEQRAFLDAVARLRDVCERFRPAVPQEAAVVEGVPRAVAGGGS
jgi:hypothetical protein